MLSFAIDSVIERQDGFSGRGQDDSIMKYALAEQSHFDRRERRPAVIPRASASLTPLELSNTT
jgi:hypothetical protein